MTGAPANASTEPPLGKVTNASVEIDGPVQITVSRAIDLVGAPVPARRANVSGAVIVDLTGGQITTAGWQGGYGLLVAVDHGKNTQTRYGHLSRLAVSPGQEVKSGDVIGYVGTTGLSTGPHLHYEVRVDGVAVNPPR